MTITNKGLNFRNFTGGPLIPEEVVSEIRKRNDIVALVSEHVKLKKSGANHVGVCPFHPDKDPSFSVHQGRQFYHCFGCHASGDVISFVMRLENRTFIEAARYLAERAGIEIPQINSADEASSKRERAQRDSFFAITEAATLFYKEQFNRHPLAKLAHKELSKRGLIRKTAETFNLGYAPHSWDSLAQFLNAKGYPLSAAERVGLIIERQNTSGYYDRFRHRLMFPIYDSHGRVVAFSGRALKPIKEEPERPIPKYINSPETPLYTKGSVLFGFYQNRLEIRRNGWAILCEGNFDLLALHQAGICNVVAPLGTAFTQAQAHLIRKLAQRVTLLFDGDSAGQKAVKAAFPLLIKAGLSARVVRLPDQHDPDSYLRSNSVEALKHLIDKSPSIVESLIDQAANSASRQADDSANAIRNLGVIIGMIESPVERHKYIELIAQRFEIHDVGTVHKELLRGSKQIETQKRFMTKNRNQGQKTFVPNGKKRSSITYLHQKQEKKLLGILLDFPELFEDPEVKNLDELLTSEQLRFIFQKASLLFQADGEISGSRLLAVLEPMLGKSELYSWLEKRLAVQKTESISAARDEVRAALPGVRKQNIERKLQLLANEIRAARHNSEENRVKMLEQQRNELWHSARNLNLALEQKG